MFKLAFLYKILPACRNDVNGMKPGSYSKATDTHAAEYQNNACLEVNKSVCHLCVMH